MLGLDGVVDVAHRVEDLLGALRDGRRIASKDLIDLLLVSAESISRSLPGAERPLPPDELAAVVDALDGAVSGDDPVTVPRLALPEVDDSDEGGRPRGGDSVRVPTRRVHDLLDVVGEAELDVRRISTHSRELTSWRPTTCAGPVRCVTPPPRPPQRASTPPRGDRSGPRARLARRPAGGRRPRALGPHRGRRGPAGACPRRCDGPGHGAGPSGRCGLPQLVRELSTTGSEPRDIDLVLSGQDVELDARVLDAVADSLRHLVTNAVDHGLREPARTRRRGQAARATVTVSARAAGSTVIIEVADNGRGVDEESLRAAAALRGLLPEGSTITRLALLQLMFAPGFSTRSEVTQTSGRGVGLDVVRTVVEDLSGTIEVSVRARAGHHVRDLAAGHPRRAALSHRPGGDRALRRAGRRSSGDGRPGRAERHEMAGVPVLIRQDGVLPLVDLGQILNVPGTVTPGRRRRAVLRLGRAIGTRRRRAGRRARAGRQGARWLPRPAAHHRGATIDGNGSVLLVLGRARARRPSARRRNHPCTAAPLRRTSGTIVPAPRPGARARILVVEDSVGVRELQRVILEGAGYDVVTAVDGLDGAARLAGLPVDLVVSDVEMPGMDGFTLTRHHPIDRRLAGRTRRDHDVAR
jgi:hypothetical protein